MLIIHRVKIAKERWLRLIRDRQMRAWATALPIGSALPLPYRVNIKVHGSQGCVIENIAAIEDGKRV